MNIDSRIYVAGDTGLLGSALLRRLTVQGYKNVITRTHSELDLNDNDGVLATFECERPEYVVIAAARVGGISANSRYSAEFIHDNLAIQTAIINAAYKVGVKRLIFFGSNCTYPRNCSQPMSEENLWTGPLESTSQAYAVAKIAGMTMCDAYNNQYGTSFISLIPPTLYGPRDHFDAESSHVLSGLMYKFDRARNLNQESVTVWGSGSQRREFMYVDDLADACMTILSIDPVTLKSVSKPTGSILNAGIGKDMTILELAHLVANVVGYKGEIKMDLSRPDGAPQKLLNSDRIRRLGWIPKVSIKDGLEMTYDWYKSHGAASLDT